MRMKVSHWIHFRVKLYLSVTVVKINESSSLSNLVTCSFFVAFIIFESIPNVSIWFKARTTAQFYVCLFCFFYLLFFTHSIFRDLSKFWNHLLAMFISIVVGISSPDLRFAENHRWPTNTLVHLCSQLYHRHLPFNDNQHGNILFKEFSKSGIASHQYGASLFRCCQDANSLQVLMFALAVSVIPVIPLESRELIAPLHGDPPPFTMGVVMAGRAFGERG